MGDVKKVIDIKEDISWIESNGSNILKQYIQLDYSCKRKYMEERVAKEFPGFELDFYDNVYGRKMKNPSQNALKELVKWVDKGYDAHIIWQMASIHGDEYDKKNNFEECEAITILFKGYYLIKSI